MMSNHENKSVDNFLETKKLDSNIHIGVDVACVGTDSTACTIVRIDHLHKLHYVFDTPVSKSNRVL
jgi:hypothetical protein